MNQRKPNNSLWYSLGLTALLCIAFLVTATGTALARYRAEQEKQITFQVRPPAQIHLGTVKTVTSEGTEGGAQETTEVFDPEGVIAWQQVGDYGELQFAVANGTSASDFSKDGQTLRLTMVGTIGLGATEEKLPKIYLILPAQAGSDTVTKIQAVPQAIAQGTALYKSNGAGWTFTFYKTNDQGVQEELSWNLPGGELHHISMTVTMEGNVPAETSQLYPMITADLVTE